MLRDGESSRSIFQKQKNMFTQKEIDYINSQHLARLATVSKSMKPDVAPVGFRFDGKTFLSRALILPRRTNTKM